MSVMSEDKLWAPDIGAVRNSRPQSLRVRTLMMNRKWKTVGGDRTDHLAGCKCKGSPSCAQFRGDFARHVVKVCLDNGLHVPGQDSREPLREGETQEDRYVDAARTRIRQLEGVTNPDGTETWQAQVNWVLVAIETAICDLEGMAYPPRAYETQGVLSVD